MFILRWNINRRIPRYSGTLQDIEQDVDLRIEASSLQISEEEKTAVLGALNDPFYLQTQVFLLFIFQLSYLLAEDGATYDQKVLSVEYVPPQTPANGSVRLQWIPDAEEERRPWTRDVLEER